jgi:hypothetical protein
MSTTQDTNGPEKDRALVNNNLKRGERLARFGEFLKKVRRKLVVNRRIIGMFFSLLKLILLIIRLLGSPRGE